MKKKIGFHLPENPLSLARIKDSFQKYVSLRRKKIFAGRNV